MAISIAVVVLSAIIGVSTWILWRLLNPSIAELDLPYLQFDDGDNSEDKYKTQSRSILSRGYKEYLKHDKPFCIRNPVDKDRPIVVLPFKYLDEVKRAPDNRLSLPLHLQKNSILNHIGGPEMSDEVIHAAKLSLNRALDRLTERLQEECVAVFSQALPETHDWTTIHLYPIFLQAFARMSARVLVGPELRDQWQTLSLGYVSTVLKAPSVVRAKYRPSLFWLAKFLEPDVKEVYKYRKQAAELLEPTIKSRLSKAKLGKQSTAGEAQEKPEDAIQWLLDAHLAKGRVPTPDDIVQNLFVLTTASIHSTSATGLSILFDTMDRPSVVADIKAEMSRVRRTCERHVSEDGIDTAVWTRQHLSKLNFLDSFMRESMRVHSFTQLTVQRLVASKPYTFKDGLTLPAGTTISFASNEYNLDPEIHSNPHASIFDPKRHVEKDKLKLHFASTEDTIVWGSGSHACPGRFFAQDALKIMLVFLMRRYTFKFQSEGKETGEEGKGRPADMPMNFNIVPNVMAPVLFKINETGDVADIVGDHVGYM
ncbi:cytochrome P450 monooxygenase [Rhypophila decipiens]|uniref:Cytochrome P450 monooxygenase n=1 Tax=Rhypophila decipiens TaxID=261697 RepID=A0AAN6Y8I6_9PEZI|nr:cytochrome P450 monooxygenase [Rhypophila decipiens]